MHMSSNSGNTWGSTEFVESIKKAEHDHKVAEEKRRVDELLGSIETEEAGRYLIGMITGH